MHTTSDPETHRPDAPGTAWLLRAERIGKHYGNTTALRDASLTLQPGEAVAITGPSGSGKSTLLHALAGIIAVDAGDIVVRRPDGSGVDDLAALADAERSAFRLHRFGFVFQQGMLVPELTASENVALPLLLAGRSRAEALQRADTELARLDLAGLGGRRPGQLSGGQAQRVAIARALVTDPTIVFADEPTGALDSRTADDVLDALLATVDGDARALVIVTHDERVAARCHRVVHLLDGRIVDAR